MNKVEPYKGIAGIYEEIRPTYPKQLIQDIIDRTGLKPEDCLLEIGAGTGKATMPFAEQGYRIQAIEIGEEMADILKDKCSGYPNVSVEVVSFENWENPSGQKYDLIYCAQAFHWIDIHTKYQKCHDLLKENGFLVLFWYQPSNDKLPETLAIDEQVQMIIDRYVQQAHTDTGKPERREHTGVTDQDARREEIINSGLFELTDKFVYTESVSNGPEQYLKAMKSVPAFAAFLDGLEDTIIKQMDQEIAEIVIEKGGSVDTLFDYTLYIARKL